MKEIDPNWNWGPVWNALRRDIDTLAWLFEEERVTQRLYVEVGMWALTGVRFPFDEFSRKVRLGHFPEGTPDDPQRTATVALDPGLQGESGGGGSGGASRQEGESPPP